jgi:hypothetical protein
MAMQTSDHQDHDVESPDGSERRKDFWNRHGGPSTRRSEQGQTEPGVKGWSEVYAADGYVLRCDWSKIGCQRELSYMEHPPRRDDGPERTRAGTNQ